MQSEEIIIEIIIQNLIYVTFVITLLAIATEIVNLKVSILHQHQLSLNMDNRFRRRLGHLNLIFSQLLMGG